MPTELFETLRFPHESLWESHGLPHGSALPSQISMNVGIAFDSLHIPISLVNPWRQTPR